MQITDYGSQIAGAIIQFLVLSFQPPGLVLQAFSLKLYPMHWSLATDN